jgi:hypothetical protein
MKTIQFFKKQIHFPIHQFSETSKKRTQQVVAFILVLAMFNLTLGCHSYFRVNTVAKPTSEKVAGLNEIQKTIIVHFNDKKWLLSDVVVKNSTVIGRLNEYTMAPTIKKVNPDRPNRYYTAVSKNQRYLLNEVHIYINEYADLGNGLISIPVGSISKLEIYDPDTAATVGSWFLGALIVTVAATAILFLIVLLTKESCPFIYTWDGKSYRFQGEIYSGSIHKQLERHDYLKLPTYTGNNSYTLKMTNEVQEIQHTNLLELVVVDHPQNITVLADKNGVISTIGKPFSPSLVISEAGADVTAQLLSKDTLFYQSNPAKDKKPLKDYLILDFPTNKNAKEAKLVIHAKNSVLLDYMIGEYNKLFGTEYNKYMKKLEKNPADKMKQWSLSQGIPLSVYVERAGSWEFVDYFNVAGPMAFKDDVLKVPLKGNESNPLRIKLEFGTFLWEIDYAALDYSVDKKLTTNIVPVKTAITEEKKDVAGLLKQDDTNYYIQPQTTNMAVVTFDLPQLTDESRTIILHTKGWYQIIHKPEEGKMDVQRLREMKKPGGFNQFVNDKTDSMAKQVIQP